MFKVIVNIVPELLQHILFPGNCSVIIMIILVFTATIVVVTSLKCAQPVQFTAFQPHKVEGVVRVFTQWDKGSSRLLQLSDLDKVPEYGPLILNQNMNTGKKSLYTRKAYHTQWAIVT
jgi:hypothetical protein